MFMQLSFAAPTEAGAAGGLLGIATPVSPPAADGLFETLLQGLTGTAPQPPVATNAPSLSSVTQPQPALRTDQAEVDGAALFEFLQHVEQYLHETQLPAAPAAQAAALSAALQQVDPRTLLAELAALTATGETTTGAAPALTDLLAARVAGLLEQLPGTQPTVASVGQQASVPVVSRSPQQVAPALQQVLQQMLQVLTTAAPQPATADTLLPQAMAVTQRAGVSVLRGEGAMVGDRAAGSPASAPPTTATVPGVSAVTTGSLATPPQGLPLAASIPAQMVHQTDACVPQPFSAGSETALLDAAAAPVVTTAVADGIARLAALLASYAPRSNGATQPAMFVGPGTTALSDTAQQLIGDPQSDTSLLRGGAQQLFQAPAEARDVAGDAVLAGEGAEREVARVARSLPADARPLPAQSSTPLTGDGGSAAEVSSATTRAAGTAGSGSAASSASTPTLSSGVSAGALVEKPTATLNASLQQRGRSVTIQMDPPELGKVSVEMVVRNNQLRAVIVAQSDAVKQVLEANIEQLRDNLEMQQISVDKLNVMVGQDGRQFASLLRDHAAQQRAGRTPLRTGARTAPPQDAPSVHRIRYGTVDMFA